MNKEQRVAILVPRLDDGGERDALWRYCREWWKKNAPAGWIIVEGHHTDGIFSRSRELNTASRLADELFGAPWEVALVIDGDIFLHSIDQALQAVQLASDTGRMCFVHDWRFALAAELTDAVINGGFDPLSLKLPHEMGAESRFPRILESEYGSYGPTWSSCQAIRRDLWEDIGGFDERFKQWGCEDWAFWTACNALKGGHDRVQGAVYHLFHKRAGEEKHPHYENNLKLGKWYMNERNNPDNMRAIVQTWKDLRDEKVQG
jgi:hypothetical protein